MKNAEQLDKKTIYKMTKGQDRHALSTLKGEEFTPDAYLFYSYKNNAGEMVDALSLLINGEVYTTSSEPVINSFNDIVDAFENEDVMITMIGRTSKSGREYNVLDVVL